MPRNTHESLRENVKKIIETIPDNLTFPTMPSRAIPDRSNSIAVYVDGQLYTEYNHMIYKVIK